MLYNIFQKLKIFPLPVKSIFFLFIISAVLYNIKTDSETINNTLLIASVVAINLVTADFLIYNDFIERIINKNQILFAWITFIILFIIESIYYTPELHFF